MGTTVLPCLTPPPARRGRPTWPPPTLALALRERVVQHHRGHLHHPPSAMTPPATGTTSCEVPVGLVPQPPGRRHRQGPHSRHRPPHRRNHPRTYRLPALQRSSPAAGPRGRRLAPPRPPRLPQLHASPPPARRGGSPATGNPAIGNPAIRRPATERVRAGLLPNRAPQAHHAPDVRSAGSANACGRRSGGDG